MDPFRRDIRGNTTEKKKWNVNVNERRKIEELKAKIKRLENLKRFVKDEEKIEKYEAEMKRLKVRMKKLYANIVKVSGTGKRRKKKKPSPEEKRKRKFMEKFKTRKGKYSNEGILGTASTLFVPKK